MMNKFVFFANTIKRVGGAQLYIRSKANYLIQKGWTVQIIYHQDGDGYITELLNYPSLRCPYLQKPSYMYIENKRNIIIKQIARFINSDNSEIVFESHSRTLASWAEVVAERIGNVKHICFDLDECISIPEPMFDFYKFKYERHELYGIQSESIKILFNGSNYNLFYGSPRLQAYGASECVADCPSPYAIELLKGYVIGIVGRLEKDYVWESAKSIKQFVDNHLDHFFTVVFVGGAPDRENPKSRIIQLYNGCYNTKLLFTGYIFPIPRTLVTLFNICLAGAGSASAICREGVLTITIDPRDFQANGILGITTQSSTFSEMEKKTILWWLEEIFNHDGRYFVSPSEFRYDFSSHIDAIQESASLLCYNTSFLFYPLSHLERIKRIINSILPIPIRELMASFVRLISR